MTFMVTKEKIAEFLSQKSIAVVGVSRSGKKFGNSVLKELKQKGYKTFPVNPNASEIDGEECYSLVSKIKEKVGAAIIVIPSKESEKVVRDAVASGVKNIWLQQGSETEETINFCIQNDINVVYGECILMFTEPAAFFHKAHRWVNGLFGKLPR